MAHENGMLGGDGIQIGTGGMALLLHGQVIIVVADDPLALGGLVRTGLEQTLQVGHTGHFAQRRHVQVDHGQLAIRRVGEMAVAVDHAGDQRASLEVHDLRIAAGGFQHVGTLAHGKDGIALDGQRFHDVVFLGSLFVRLFGGVVVLRLLRAVRVRLFLDQRIDRGRKHERRIGANDNGQKRAHHKREEIESCDQPDNGENEKPCRRHDRGDEDPLSALLCGKHDRLLRGQILSVFHAEILPHLSEQLEAEKPGK